MLHNETVNIFSVLCHWAIPEIRCTPRKEDMGIQNILSTFIVGIPPLKLITFMVTRVKKTWEFPPNLNSHSQNSLFF